MNRHYSKKTSQGSDQSVWRSGMSLAHKPVIIILHRLRYRAKQSASSQVWWNPFFVPQGPSVKLQVRLNFIFTSTTRILSNVTETERPKHAMEIASTLPLDIYDAVALLSGDGLIHEVFRGFAEHANPVRAFATPIAPVPTGSGNGTSLNLLGLKVCSHSHISPLTLIRLSGRKALTSVSRH